MICPKCGLQNAPSSRQCAQCGAFLPDASNPEFSAANNNGVQDQFAQPAPQGPDQSRYQEYTMSDVVAKKSHKKLIIWLVVIALVLALGVATFFIVRGIISSSKTNEIKNDPTGYVFGSYQNIAQELTNQNKVIKTAVSAPAGQKTVKTSITCDSYSDTTVYSVDSENRKLYYSQKMDFSPSAFGETVVPNSYSAELLATPEKAVVKANVGDKSLDYFLGLEGLRENALTSAFGPEGENILHIDRATYDLAMDVYEFVYENVFKNADPFSLSILAQKLKDDFDNCGNITVTDEKVTIDGTEVNAHVVSHTFNNADVVTAVINDIKSWLKDMTGFNAQVSNYIDEALAKFDPATLVSQITAQGSFELSIKHYINDNGQLMKAEIRFIANGTGAAITLNVGADPSSTKQISLVASSIVSGQGEITLETITLKNESTDAQDKYIITLSGLAVLGEITYTRDTASGDFNIKGNISNSMAGMMMTTIQPDVEGSKKPTEFDVSGNLKTDENGTVTLTYNEEMYDGSELKYEFIISAAAEIPELTSQNDILKATSAELQQAMSIFYGSSVPVDTISDDASPAVLSA